MSSSTGGGQSRSLILTAMIFAVAMTFIDQTIVSIAAPTIQHDLGLSVQRHAVGDQRLPADAGRLLRLRRPPGRHAGASQDGGARGDHLRGRVGVVRRHAARQRGGGVAGGVPRAAGPRRGDHVPGRHRHRGRYLRPALAWPGPGAVLRHRRSADRDRPDRRRVPDRVDLAGDFLDQHTGRPDRAGADRHLQAAERGPSRADGLPGPGPDRRRGRAERLRLPAVGPVGLGQPGHRGEHRGRAWSCWSYSSSSSAGPNRR